MIRAVQAEALERVRRTKLLLFRMRHGNEFVVRAIQGNKMKLSLRDTGISTGLLAHGFWEPLGTQMLRESVKPGDVVCDIGANMGYFALQESRLVGDTGKILAVEPVPANIELLKHNIELNGVQNVEVFRYAMGDKDDPNANIYLSHRLNCGSMIFRTKELNLIGGVEKKVPVEQITLDHFIEGKPTPTYLRMDVEGYEYEIINGMKGLLAKGGPLKMLIELHPGYLGTEKLFPMLDLLKQHGFRCGIAADRQLDTVSPAMLKSFYWLTDRLNDHRYKLTGTQRSKGGFFWRDADLDDLKAFGNRPIYPHVLFVRD
jgi:FkbM family methyltransferase